MDAFEFIEKKYKFNNWRLYPPSNALVCAWLKEYALEYHLEQNKTKNIPLKIGDKVLLDGKIEVEITVPEPKICIKHKNQCHEWINMQRVSKK